MEIPYPDAKSLSCQHYNRAVLDDGPVDLEKEAESLMLWLHSAIDCGGIERDGVVSFEIGSPAHHSLCRLIEGVRRLRNEAPDSTGTINSIETLEAVLRQSGA